MLVAMSGFPVLDALQTAVLRGGISIACQAGARMRWVRSRVRAQPARADRGRKHDRLKADIHEVGKTVITVKIGGISIKQQNRMNRMMR